MQGALEVGTVELVIAGGKRACGGVGSRWWKQEAAIAIMAGSLLAEGDTIIENAPGARDVSAMSAVLREMGGVSIRRAGPVSSACSHTSLDSS